MCKKINKYYKGLSDTFIIIPESTLALNNFTMQLFYQIENVTKYKKKT